MKTPKSTKSTHSKTTSKIPKNYNNSHNKKIKYPLYYLNYNKVASLSKIEKKVRLNLIKSYATDSNFYNTKVINEIICDDSSHIVALFKDYLIYGDYSEFIQCSYSLSESKDILPKIYEYYESCSVIYPNYIVLPEAKYIYKNIQRKQRVIDNQQEIEEEKNKSNNSSDDSSKIFDTKAVDSILNQTDTSTIRALMGMKESKNKKENSIYEIILDKITKAEQWCKDQTERNIINCALRIKHKHNKESISRVIKGRNYNRMNNTMNKISSISEKENKTKTKSTIRNLCDKDMISFFKSKKNSFRHRQNKSLNIKRGVVHSLMSTNIDLIRKTFKEMAKKNSFRNSIKISTMTSPNSLKVKHCDIKGTSSLSSSKTNIRSSSQSRSTASMTKISNQILSKFITRQHSKERLKPEIAFIPHKMPLTTRESKKIPLTHRNAKSGLLTGKNKDSELKQKVITLNNGKILKTCIHFQSNSTLDKKSSVIQNRKEIKGIKIEGFEQLLSNNYTSRGSSNSQRSAVGNKSTSSRKKVKELVHSPFNKGYI